jgi:hypothetical protein
MPEMTKAREDLDRIADRIRSTLVIRRFPEDYWEPPSSEIPMEIPKGEAIMFRKDEYVQVMVGDDRFNFTDRHFAKFFYYCVKTGSGKTVFPDHETLLRITREFEEDMDRLRSDIRAETAKLPLDRLSQEKVEETILQRIGIGDIV